MEREEILKELYTVIRMDDSVAKLDPALIAQKVSACRIALREQKPKSDKGKKNAALWLAHLVENDQPNVAEAIAQIAPYAKTKKLSELAEEAGLLKPGQKFPDNGRAFSKALTSAGFIKKKSGGIMRFRHPQPESTLPDEASKMSTVQS